MSKVLDISRVFTDIDSIYGEKQREAVRDIYMYQKIQEEQEQSEAFEAIKEFHE